MEDLLYEAESARRFAGLRLSEPLPDEGAILHFRHLLEAHQLGQGLFEEIKGHLEEQGVRLREGTIVDATILEAPPCTKDSTGQRDPEMRQVKKGNQYHFGMKLHMGVDAKTGLVHSFSTTSANVHEVTEAHRLLHGGERQVWGDAGYTGVQKREENLELAVQWQVALKPGQRRKLEPGSSEALAEKVKASMRAKSCPVAERGTLPGLGQPEAGPGDSGHLTQAPVRPNQKPSQKPECWGDQTDQVYSKPTGNKPLHKRHNPEVSVTTNCSEGP